MTERKIERSHTKYCPIPGNKENVGTSAHVDCGDCPDYQECES
jgi:hypothetical protein